jgi:hypothetical protein
MVTLKHTTENGGELSGEFDELQKKVLDCENVYYTVTFWSPRHPWQECPTGRGVLRNFFSNIGI